MRRLGISLEARIPYIAVPEYRHSGCGLPGIPLHYHCLIACRQPWAAVFPEMATHLWESMAGNCKIDPYDPVLSGAHYIAKLAGHENFDWICDNLERLTPVGPMDLYASAQGNPYVPVNAKGHNHLTTLVLSKVSPPASTSMHLVATTETSADGYTNSPKPHAVQTKVVSNGPGNKKANGHVLTPPKQPGPTVPWVATIWREQMKKWFKITVPAKLPPGEFGKLTVLRDELGKATLAVVEHAAEHWPEFAQQASSLAGYESWPHTPSIGFLVAHRRTAFSIVYQTVRHKSWHTAREWCVIKQAAVLEQYWGKL
jgi:hypothetical protein